MTKEEMNAYQKKWRADHPDYLKTWRQEHPSYHKDYYQKLKAGQIEPKPSSLSEL